MWGRFFVPVLALFYIASQVNLHQFGIIMSIFAFTTLLFEIPSGILADLIGKKNILILSRICSVVEVAMLAFGNGFWLLLVAKIISGIGLSMSSGTHSALLYDSLRRSFKEHKHLQVRGMQQTITLIARATVFIVGAWLFTINPKLPAKLSLIPLTVGLILTFFLKEPYKPNRHFVFATIGRHLNESISYFRRKTYVRYIVFYALPITATISILLSLSSYYFEQISIPIGLIGILAFIMSMLTAYAANKAITLKQALTEKEILYLAPIILVIGTGLLALALPYVGALFYIIIAFIDGCLLVLIDNFMNKHIESTNRTTMLSIKNFFTNLGVLLLFPFIGNLIEISIGLAYGILAGILAIYMPLFFYLSNKKKKRKYHW